MTTRRRPSPILAECTSSAATRKWRREVATEESAVYRTRSRYTRLGTLGSGGMGVVELARSTGSAGFSRVVAVKRLHPHLAAEKAFVAMLVDEARVTSSLHHVNIIDTLDLVADENGFSLVLDYVEGAALNVLMRDAVAAGEAIPRPIALALISGVLRGLDAVHEAKSSEGQPLGIVHRDISPQNVLVGVDGVPRIIDFGVAKALGKVTQTRPGEIRGKFAYMAPEQLRGLHVTRQSDVYAAGVLLWELLTSERLFAADDARAVCGKVLSGDVRPPSAVVRTIPKALDAVVLKAIAQDVGARYLTARELLDALAPFERASDDEVGRWVRRIAAGELAERAALIQNAEPEACRTVDDLVAEMKRSSSRPPSIVATQPRQHTLRMVPPPPPDLLPPVSVSNPISVQFGLIYMLCVALVVVMIGVLLGAVTAH